MNSPGISFNNPFGIEIDLGQAAMRQIRRGLVRRTTEMSSDRADRSALADIIAERLGRPHKRVLRRNDQCVIE
jgi:hypothetical protein